MGIKELKEIIKLQIADPRWTRYKKKIALHKEKRVFLIGSPVHGNLGDHAIAEEEKKFLKEYFPDYTTFEILMPFYHTQKKFLRKHINLNDIVCVSGGGWMGNLWIHNEIVVREIIRDYQKNQIVIFPQTLHYTDDVAGREELQKTIYIFEQHKNLLIGVRDRNSYNLIVDKFKLNGHSKAIYCPDMVLYGHCPRKLSSNGCYSNINICIRDDCEGLYKSASEVISQLIPAPYYSTTIDTVIPHRIPLKKRTKELQMVWRKFAESKLVITDRLHAMLFSYINGTPCIALNNKTGKVFGVYEWIAEQNLVVCVNSINEIKEKLPLMLEVSHKNYDEGFLRGEFENLAKLIREGVLVNGNKKIIGNKCTNQKLQFKM